MTAWHLLNEPDDNYAGRVTEVASEAALQAARDFTSSTMAEERLREAIAHLGARPDVQSVLYEAIAVLAHGEPEPDPVNPWPTVTVVMLVFGIGFFVGVAL